MATTNTYDIGDTVRLFVRFLDVDGALADPTLAVILTKNPKGAETTNSTTKESTGVYYFDQVIGSESIRGDGEDAEWFYRGKGTGALVAAAEHSFKVRQSKFDNP